MKWIGQHIYDYISRFRSDVYLDSPTAGGSDPDKFLGIDSNGKIVYRTGAEVLSDIGAAASTSDITRVSFTTDSGTGGAIAKVDSGNADFAILGGEGIDVTNTSGGGGSLQLDVVLDLNEVTTSTDGNDIGEGSIVFVDTTGGGGKIAPSNVPLSIFNNDSGFAAGDITGVTIQTDSGSGSKATDTAGSADFILHGGSGMDVTNSSATITVAGEDASTSNKGVASFSSNNFSVSSGAVSLATAQTWASPVITTDQWNFESANSADPLVVIKNTTDDASGGRLRFLNSRGADGQDGDEAGLIQFYSYDDGTPSGEEYAAIKATIHDATSTEESGKLQLQVASHDGGTEDGLVLTGGSVDAEVDVTIGNGAASVTTVAGDLVVTGTGNTHFVGQYAVLRCSAFYLNDNPMVQNSLYFGSATGNQPMNWNDPAAVGGVIGDTSSFTIAGDDENWGIVLPFNISKIEVQCSMRPQLGTTDDFTVAIYTGTRSTDSSADLTLTKVAHNSVNISGTVNRYTQNDVDYTGDLNKGTMIYVGIGTEDSTDMKNGRGYMNITVVRR